MIGESEVASVTQTYDIGYRVGRTAEPAVENASTQLKAALELESLLGSVPAKRLNRWYVYHAAKRAIDIFGSLFGLVVLSPVFLVVAVLIKLQDGGPVLFRQKRVGQNGHPFWFYKFRSMVPNAEALKKSLLSKNDHADPRTFKMKDDPRVTPVGKIIRRLSLDELPQLFNVLIGDMSLVGPRPATIREFQQYTNSDKARVVVRPGLTCIWQVSGRGNLDFGEQLQLDLIYIERRSLWLDGYLLLRTIPAVLSGDGAE